jgi:hypothetical protein
MEERDELVKKVFPDLRRRCKERFVEVLEVELRWGITEEQSKSGETLRICLEEVTADRGFESAALKLELLDTGLECHVCPKSPAELDVKGG